MDLETKNLRLIAHTPENLLALMSGEDSYQRQTGLRLASGFLEMYTSNEPSPEWLTQLRNSSSADPWKHGFAVLHRVDNVVIGGCGFKGPPNAEGMVEIAYGIAPDYRGRGHATEVALALIALASQDAQVRLIRAHTLPEKNASARVLEKCGFECLGEVIDPEDGKVWRWEKAMDPH